MSNPHEPLDFGVHQEDDVVPSRALVKIAATSVAIGAVGVFFGGVVLVAATGAIRADLGAGPPPVVSREISDVEQTPIWRAQAGIDLREEQRRELQSWRWIDRRAGLVAIPIDQAMDVVVQEEQAR